ncbi:MAG: MFS family permease [Sulfurimonas sp.]|jgi:MFS family permease
MNNNKINNNKVNNFALLLVSPLSVMSSTILTAVIPYIAIHFQDVAYAKLLSQLILSIPYLSIALFAPFVYHIVNFFGKKKTFIYALIYVALLGALTGLLDNLYLIVVARFFFGFGIATISSIFLSLVGDYFEMHSRNIFLGYQSSFAFLMGAVFTMLGAWVGEYSWQYSFYLFLVILLVAFTSVLFLKFPKSQTKRRRPFQFKLFKNNFSIFFFAFLLKLIFFIFPTQIPFLLLDKGLENYIGVVLSLLLVFAVISSFMYGYISKKISLNSLLVTVLLLKAISYFSIAVATSIVPILMATVLSGTATGLLHIIFVKYLLDKIPQQDRLSGTSILISTMHFGFFLSPIALYPLISTFNVAFSFLVASVILVASSLYIYIKKLS